jgi:hypothetical protein
MPDSSSHQPITVTAEERVHPAMRKLARACLELARQVKGLLPETEPALPSEEAQLAQSERTHD